ncbi:acyl-CoA dehydratase activase, partial [Planctomycetota bacterium]
GQRCQDLIQATIRGVLSLRPGTRNIIDIGGNSATYIELDAAGRFRSFTQNTLCAAGTGSFVDEQLARLGVSYAELRTLEHVENPPSIASRCAVFAKTDMIHRQQEGYTKAKILEGLCRSMVHTCLDGLLQGRVLTGPTVLVGGACLNSKIVYWLANDFVGEMVSLEVGHVVSAIGAALGESRQASWPPAAPPARTTGPMERRRQLRLARTSYPTFAAHRSYVREDTEVRELVPLPQGPLEIYLGIDIGSTSTKAAIVDRDRRLVLDLYRQTQGDPVGATKRILRTLLLVAGQRQLELCVLGSGTTGSGRKLIGELIGADLVINEITAHAIGAATVTTEAETVFEIGGQDAKYMRLRDGQVVDSNMNYVCAAGTGSFVEEQARKLGFAVTEVGDAVLGVAPPFTSDRCTIFMEQDIRKLLRCGSSREEVLAATMYSVIQNYLAKVVGNRKVSDRRVVFVGATARNKGLVAAFEQLLDVEVLVPTCCHVMGAFGVCMKLTDTLPRGARSSFRGFDLVETDVAISETDCALCTNYCRVTSVSSSALSDELSWGYMCGREPASKKKRDMPGLALLQTRDRLLRSFHRPAEAGRPTVGIPMALSTYQFLPLWSAFFDALGFNLVTSRQSSPELRAAGVRLAAADFCYPAKVGLGHVAHLLEDERVDHLFLPSMIENAQNEETTRSYLCPMVINKPYYGKAAIADHRRADRVFFAAVNLNWPSFRLLDFLESHLGARLGVGRGELREAWQLALCEQRRFESLCQEAGREFLQKGLQDGGSCLVLLGRPYVVYDYGVNLRLPQTIASYGHTVLPVDLLPFDRSTRRELVDSYGNMYWHFGQVILNAVEVVRSHPNLHAILLTSFNCGPDSFLCSYTEKSMGQKPLLTLELDEHASAGGYLTRLEAFFDNVASSSVKTSPKYRAGVEVRTLSDLAEDEDVVIQHNPDPLPSVYASALRRHGFRCKVLRPSSAETYNLGLKHMKGTECCPAIESAGSILAEARRSEGRSFNVIYPGTCGPCRLGQYVHKYNDVLLSRVTDARHGFITFKLNVDQLDGFGVDFKLSVFRGVVAIDVLKKMLHRTRPYERESGSADAIYERGRLAVLNAVEAGEAVDAIVSGAAEEFSALPVDRSLRRPLVGIVGEFFVRVDSFMNQDLIRTIEEHGGEAWLVDTTEWQIWGTSRSLPQYGEYGEGLTDTDGDIDGAEVLTFLEEEQDRLIGLCGELLRDRHEPHMRNVYEAARDYVDVTCPNEVLPIVGRAILFATRDGASLVVNAKPFSCLPGNMAGAVLNRVRGDVGFAFLDIAYEGSGDPNAPVRTMLANLRSTSPG